QEFDEEEGRRRFLLYLRPIINGTGNYYVETQTRSHDRMDLVIDYLGKRHIVELKVWRGKAYHEKGESQLAGYLDSYHLDKGYMLTYNFNKHKENGVKTVRIEGKELIEVFV
ncbi:MAG: GxxExxY protein, partial [Lachnospiraceae bacterium]